MAGLKNISPIDSILEQKIISFLESVALTNGRHFSVKDLFNDKSDKHNDDQDDAAYNNKFHGL